MTSFFKTNDLIGHHYLAMVIPSLSQLHLLSYDISKGEAPSFDAITTIHATQVIPLHNLSMILILGADKQLMLYSGPHKVSMVTMLHPLMPSPMDSNTMEDSTGSTVGGRVVKIRDGLGDSFTVELVSGEMFRCSLPSFCQHPVGMWLGDKIDTDDFCKLIYIAVSTFSYTRRNFSFKRIFSSNLSSFFVLP